MRKYWGSVQGELFSEEYHLPPVSTALGTGLAWNSRAFCSSFITWSMFVSKSRGQKQSFFSWLILETLNLLHIRILTKSTFLIFSSFLTIISWSLWSKENGAGCNDMISIVSLILILEKWSTIALRFRWDEPEWIFCRQKVEIQGRHGGERGGLW